MLDYNPDLICVQTTDENGRKTWQRLIENICVKDNESLSPECFDHLKRTLEFHNESVWLLHHLGHDDNFWWRGFYRSILNYLDLYYRDFSPRQVRKINELLSLLWMAYNSLEDLAGEILADTKDREAAEQQNGGIQ